MNSIKGSTVMTPYAGLGGSEESDRCGGCGGQLGGEAGFVWPGYGHLLHEDVAMCPHQHGDPFACFNCPFPPEVCDNPSKGFRASGQNRLF